MVDILLACLVTSAFNLALNPDPKPDSPSRPVPKPSTDLHTDEDPLIIINGFGTKYRSSDKSEVNLEPMSFRNGRWCHVCDDGMVIPIVEDPDHPGVWLRDPLSTEFREDPDHPGTWTRAEATPFDYEKDHLMGLIY